MQTKQKDIITETQLSKWLGMTPEQIDKARREDDFPYLMINKRCRVYYIEDVIRWLMLRKEGFPVE